MLKVSLNTIRNLIFNKHNNGQNGRSSFIPKSTGRASFSLTESRAWRDVFGSNDIESIFKYYRSFAYSCINARAENVAKAEVYLYERNGKKLNERIHHPFLDLMKSVNMYRQIFRDIPFINFISKLIINNLNFSILDNLDSIRSSNNQHAFIADKKPSSFDR